MLSTQQLGTFHVHFRSKTAAPAVFAAVTAVVGFEMIEVDSIRLSLDAAKPPITSLFSYSASAVTATKAARAAVSDKNCHKYCQALG